MLEAHEIFYSINTVLYAITTITLAIASFILYSKHKSTGTLLMVIGAVASLLFMIFEKIMFFAASTLDMFDLLSYQGVLYIFSNLGMLFFVIGLFLLGYQTHFSGKSN